MQKEETHRTHPAVGGDRIDHTDDKINPTSNLTTEKCPINNTPSTINAKCLVADINYFYLNTKMDRFDYKRFEMDIIPKEIIEQ